MPATIQLGIVEDQPLIMENLSTFMEMQPDVDVVLKRNSVEDFLDELLFHQQINTILLDIKLPGMTGIEGIRHIREKLPNADIIMLTAFEETEHIFNALCAGAVSYISKRTPLVQVKDALFTVHRGGSYMSPLIARKVIGHFKPKQKTRDPDSALTPRQEQIVQGLVDGLSYKLIADKYDISLETVRDHIKKIYRKLEVNSKADVIRKKLEGDI
ncbi:MAG: response regulator transcription factor [Phaeodactylibacter sp.]|nr:response regulator transcription factor [Phaeodactylibacter sp.]